MFRAMRAAIDREEKRISGGAQASLAFHGGQRVGFPYGAPLVGGVFRSGCRGYPANGRV